MHETSDGQSEAELIDQLQAGSTLNSNRAYQQLLDLHLPAINRYVIRMLGSANDAEDITQEVFLRLWQKSASFNPGLAKLSTWLHQIAHNLCIDYFRKNKSDRHDPDVQAEDLTGGIEPQRVQQQLEQALNISEAIQLIPERQRSAIVMCHYQGLSNKDAANVLNVSIDALESLLSRARRKLRDLLQGSRS